MILGICSQGAVLSVFELLMVAFAKVNFWLQTIANELEKGEFVIYGPKGQLWWCRGLNFLHGLKD